MFSRTATGSIALTAVLVALTCGSLAHGATRGVRAFPGKNGLIAFNSEGSVWVVAPGGGSPRQVTQTGVTADYPGVSFSPDGKLIAYSGLSNTDPDIYTVRPDGGGKRQVTFSRGADSDPSWSSDGKRIAFETNRNGNIDIYSVDSRGRSPVQLTNGPDDEQDPAWSPKGDRIAYTVASKDGLSRQLWVMATDGSGKTQLTTTPNFSENPNWSPDGRRIVFDSDRVEKGDLELYSMKADGSDVRRLTNSPALDALPAFSPDGTNIVFVSDRLQKDSRRLFVMPATGGKARRLIAGDEPNFQMVPDWQPLRLGVAEKPAVPPGRPLPPAGVADRVDPLYDRTDAWAVPMTSGVTYRINLSLRSGCASIGVYRPGTHAFGTGHRADFHPCGGYFTFTPGPGGGGTYSLLVSAQAGSQAIVAYHLQAAAAGPDDQGPGVLLDSKERVKGTLSGGGIDAVDLYRFDVARQSTVHVALESGPGISLALKELDGSPVKQDQAGTIGRTLAPGTYLIAVSAEGRAGGTYVLDLLVRAVTTTILTANGKRSITTGLGTSVVLQTVTTPAPNGGAVRLQLEYQDPLGGWVYRKTWTTAPGSSIAFVPPAVGNWRVRASYAGTDSYGPSQSELATIHVAAAGQAVTG